jgi:hypothetical protein
MRDRAVCDTERVKEFSGTISGGTVSRVTSWTALVVAVFFWLPPCSANSPAPTVIYPDGKSISSSLSTHGLGVKGDGAIKALHESLKINCLDEDGGSPVCTIRAAYRVHSSRSGKYRFFFYSPVSSDISVLLNEEQQPGRVGKASELCLVSFWRRALLTCEQARELERRKKSLSEEEWARLAKESGVDPTWQQIIQDSFHSHSQHTPIRVFSTPFEVDLTAGEHTITVEYLSPTARKDITSCNIFGCSTGNYDELEYFLWPVKEWAAENFVVEVEFSWNFHRSWFARQFGAGSPNIRCSGTRLSRRGGRSFEWDRWPVSEVRDGSSETRTTHRKYPLSELPDVLTCERRAD